MWLPETSAGVIVWPPSSRGTGHRSVPRRSRCIPSSVRTACARRAHAAEFECAIGRSPGKKLGHRTARPMARIDWATGPSTSR